jgi:hypothetical protein
MALVEVTRPRLDLGSEDAEYFAEGERHDALTRAAGQMRSIGMTANEVLAALLKMNEQRCVPPLPRAEVETIARSALGWEKGEALAPPIVRKRPGGTTPVLGHRQKDGPSLVLTPADEIEIRPAKWLWKDRLPVGELSLLAGRESVGKSTLDCWFSARVSTGTLPGESHGTPRNVLVAATEDNWKTTIGPRLMAAGADRSRVYRVNVEMQGTGRTAQLNLPENFGAFEEALRRLKPALVIFSPLMSRLSGKLDTHKDQEVRRALEPLVELAERYETCILGLIHLNKGGGSDPLRAVMASTAFVAISRAVLFVHRDPDSPETRLLGQPKNNLGKSDWELGLLTYRIEEVTVGPSPDGEPVTATRVVWGEAREGSIEQVLADSNAAPETRTATGEAAAWLTAYLTDEGGHAPREQVVAAASGEGHGLSALNRARVKAGVIPQRTSTVPSTTEWVLPSAMPQPEVTMRQSSHNRLSQPSEMTGTTSHPSRPSHQGHRRTGATRRDEKTAEGAAKSR